MKNLMVRVALLEKGLHVYDLVDILHVSESTVTRKMRKEMPAEEQVRIIDLIESFPPI